MGPVVIGAIVLIVLVLAFFAWKYWKKGHCKADADCKSPDTCQNGKCAPLTPPLVCTSTQLAKLGMLPVNGKPPGACAPSADGKWLLFPNAWYAYPDQDHRTGITGSPKGPLSAAACQAFCAADSTCTSWISDPASTASNNCYAFSTVPTSLQGDPAWSMGVSAATLGP
jgi:hypothetical protein